MRKLPSLIGLQNRRECEHEGGKFDDMILLTVTHVPTQVSEAIPGVVAGSGSKRSLDCQF